MSNEQKLCRGDVGGKLLAAEGWIELVTVPAARLGITRKLQLRLARRALRSAIAATPPPELAWRRDLVIGQSLRLLGRHRQAIGPLLAALRRQPQQRQGWIALGWCLKRLGRPDRAARVMSRAINVLPDDAVLHFNFACYLALLNQAELAIGELLWAIELEPSIRGLLSAESDFDLIRGSASFQTLCHSTV
ncbi:TPR end-of-group domain-containing protein [Planctomycetaceae bacterium SH139]